MTDNNSRFTLKMYFGCEDSAINFHNDEKPVKVISYIGSGPGVGTRNKLWSCGSVKGGDNLFNKRVMTPYLLDTILRKNNKRLHKFELYMSFEDVEELEDKNDRKECFKTPKQQHMGTRF